MGKGRDKRKKAKGHVSGQGASKTARKTSLNDAKKDRRSQRMGEGDDEDIDVLLARFELQDKAAKAVTVHEDCGAPSARVNCTILHTNNPKLDEVVMFGGEYWDKATDKVHTYNDLYRYDCGRNKWKHITSATSPSPRCAHAASVLGSCLYVVGGEFQTPNQDRFRHFKDVWRLDLASNTWDQLPCKGGPSPRSGARMLTWKGRLLLFGGYYDADTKLKYYNDAWEYDVEAFKWRELGDAGSALRPSPRSGCGLVLDGDVLYVIGGYTRVVDEDEPDMQHGQALHDVWALDLLSEQWRKVKRQGMAPGPRRGFRVVTQKRRAIMFGGSHDNETHGGEDISSEFFNDMYQFSLDSQRWFPLALKGSKQRGENAEGRRATNAGDDSVAAGHSGAVQHGAAGHGHLDDSRKDAEVIRAATRIQANYRGHRVRKAYKLFRIGGIVSEILYSPASYGTDMSVKNMPKPRARVNASLVVIKSTLWVFGGLVEIFDKEITLDDIWKLNLNKMDQWTCVKENTVGEEDFKDTHVSSDDDDEDD